MEQPRDVVRVRPWEPWSVALLVGLAACNAGPDGRSAVGDDPGVGAAAGPREGGPLAPPADLGAPPPGAVAAVSGLRWRVLSAGTGGPRPAVHDRVSIHYTSWNPDGSVYATSLRRGAPAVLRVSDASAGWQEALTQMVPGEKRRLWIPAALARTRSGGPAGALVSDVELVQVAAQAPPAPAPPDLLRPPADAERSASGLVSRQLKPPTSDERAERHDRARVVYVGWDASGHAFDSSAPRGPFAEVTMTHGFPGWQEALAMLREGEQRRFWIPSALAYDSYPGTVRGPLVYDIELVEVIDMPAPPEVPSDVATAPRSAVRLPSGVAYRVLTRGSGSIAPGPGGIVDMHYTYWTPSGRLLDSTLPNARPFRADLEDRDLPQGVTEVVASMVPGERRRIWVPEPLGYPATHPAKGPLVFDVEVLVVYRGKKRVDWVEPAPR